MIKTSWVQTLLVPNLILLLEDLFRHVSVGGIHHNLDRILHITLTSIRLGVSKNKFCLQFSFNMSIDQFNQLCSILKLDEEVEHFWHTKMVWDPDLYIKKNPTLQIISLKSSHLNSSSDKLGFFHKLELVSSHSRCIKLPI